jgi:hypothetical protein
MKRRAGGVVVGERTYRASVAYLVVYLVFFHQGGGGSGFGY